MSHTNQLISIDTVTNLLPNPPDDFEYEVIQDSPQIISIWLLHPPKYNYTSEPVRTIHSFVKADKVHAPISSKKMRREVLCPVTQLYTLPSYTAIIPKTTSLLHL